MSRRSTAFTIARTCALGLAATWLLAPIAFGHFQTLIPSTSFVTPETGRSVDLELIFTHPMENGPAMEMGEPVSVGVMIAGEKIDLGETLRSRKVDGKTAYDLTYRVNRPGDHIFFVEPAPYWEPAEEKMIIHYTKVVVNAYGEEEGWDEMVGFPVEIEPLSRPYGLWTGNCFRGIVRRNGEPVPFAEIEVEYLNSGDDPVEPPADPFVTQVIKADAAGVFVYSMPRAGWWAFAALVDGEEKRTDPKGRKVDVELGGLIWVQTIDMDR